jgi:hypothetical protein
MSDTRTRGPSKRVEPAFINKSEIVQHLGLGCPSTINDWIADGTWPPPHSEPGRKYSVWRRPDWNHYVSTGSWPRSAWPERKG